MDERDDEMRSWFSGLGEDPSAPFDAVANRAAIHARVGALRRRRIAGGAAALLIVAAGAGTAFGLFRGSGGQQRLTAEPGTTTSTSAEPTDTTSPSASSSPSASESSTPATPTSTTSTPAGSVTLSLSGPLKPGQEETLHVHVVAADAWTAYQLTFNGAFLDMDRVFPGGGDTNQGEIDAEDYLPVCAKHGDLSTPTNTTHDFTFSPLRTGHFHAIVAVVHGTCDIPNAGTAAFNLTESTSQNQWQFN